MFVSMEDSDLFKAYLPTVLDQLKDVPVGLSDEHAFGEKE
jgi:hypothetical protein